MVLLSIAVNTFRETVRDKVLYTILLFALGFVLVSVIISEWSISQEEKIIQDFGLTIITVFSLIISIFIGINLVYKELEKRTVYTILSKPVSRGAFLTGKYFGLLMTLSVIVSMMAVGLLMLTWLFAGIFNPYLLLAVLLMFFEMAIIIAFALFFSTFTSPVLSAILSLFVFVAGNFSTDVRILGPGTSNPLFGVVLDFLYFLVPNLDLYDIQLEVVHGLPLNSGNIALSVAYCIAYAGALLVIASLIFGRRDLK